MKPYHQYTVLNFLKDDDFCRWVIRGNESDNIFWENWLIQHPESKDRLEIARSLLQSIKDSHNYLSEEVLEAELAKIVKLRSAKPLSIIKHISLPNHFFKYAAFASVLAFGVLFYFVNKARSSDPFENFVEQEHLSQAGVALVKVSNDGENPKIIDLEDGSRVTLNPKSWLHYPKQFGADTRRVYLTGGAFFEVSKNPSRPFVVITNDLITTVLGTSFTITSFEGDQNSSVQVRTGKVTVSSPGRSKSDAQAEFNAVVLLPNQQVVYHRKDQKLVRTLVENPLPLEGIEPAEEHMVFEDVAVTEVFEVLKKQYGVQIICDEEMLSQCQLNAELGKEPLMDKIGMICTAIRATYEVIDGQIIIKGSACGSTTF